MGALRQCRRLYSLISAFASMTGARHLACSCLLLLLAAAWAQQLHRTEWATILTAEQETSDVDVVATQASTVVSALIRPRLSFQLKHAECCLLSRSSNGVQRGCQVLGGVLICPTSFYPGVLGLQRCAALFLPACRRCLRPTRMTVGPSTRTRNAHTSAKEQSTVRMCVIRVTPSAAA